MVTQKDGLDIQKAVLLTPKTEPATQQAAVITQTTQFVVLHCVGNCTGGSGCDTGDMSPSARRSDQGLEPDAAAGRVLMNDVFCMASGRRQVLLVMELWFDTRFSNADAVGVSCVPVSGLWLLLLAI